MDFIEPCFGIGHNLSLICQMTSEDIKHQLIIIITGQIQSPEAVWKSRRPSWAPVPNKPTVSVDVKQHSTTLDKLGLKVWWEGPDISRHSSVTWLMQHATPHYTRLFSPALYRTSFFLLLFSLLQLSVQRLLYVFSNTGITVGCTTVWNHVFLCLKCVVCIPLCNRPRPLHK